MVVPESSRVPRPVWSDVSARVELSGARRRVLETLASCPTSMTAAEIAAGGPISVAQYMMRCLHDPQDGYYATRPALGADGDFVTAPLVSQMFGELIGLWAAEKLGKSGADAEAYAKSVVVADFEEAGDEDVVRKVKESASLGVGGIGSLSLPVEGSLDSMVKVSSETVDDATLYQRFFELLGQYLDRSVAPEAVPAAAS